MITNNNEQKLKTSKTLHNYKLSNSLQTFKLFTNSTFYKMSSTSSSTSSSISAPDLPTPFRPLAASSHDVDTVHVASLNMLAGGLSYCEFLTDAGDERCTVWFDGPQFQGRGQRIANVMSELFSNGVSVLATQENDQPFWLEKRVQETHPNVRMVNVRKYDTMYKSNAYKFMTRQLRKASAEFVAPYDEFGVHDDTLAVYFDCSVVCPTRLQYITISEKKGIKTLAAVLSFETKHTHVPFHCVVAHLKSGEKAGDAAQRVKECTAITTYLTDNMSTDDNLVWLMDSNSSAMYRSADDSCENDDVFDHLRDAGFSNLILPNTGFKCFKMRHGSGGQPNKFGQFMFDTIDKIAIKGPSITGFANPHPLESFVTYDRRLTPRQVQELHLLRTDAAKRATLCTMVTTEQWSDMVGFSYDRETHVTRPIPDNELLPQSVQRCLYPNTLAPSDHPPVMATIFLRIPAQEPACAIERSEGSCKGCGGCGGGGGGGAPATDDLNFEIVGFPTEE